MENLEFNKRYLVKDKMLNHELLFYITLEPSKVFTDAVIVNDEYFNECYYLDVDELFSTFEFLN